MEKFQKIMASMEENDEDGFNWLADKPPAAWSRSHFRTWPKCHILTNNICEAFNKVIRKARGKPIISMMEQIRVYLMEKMQRGRLEIEKYDNTICPHIQEKSEKKKLLFGAFVVKWSGKGKFQVSCGGDEQYSVDIYEKTCACRYWDLTRIPCEHAIACIYHREKRPEDFVHDCYKTDTQRKIYEHLIQPINGCDMWPQSTKTPLAPPFFRRQPGRPKKARTKYAIEKEDEKKKPTKLVRRNTTVMCGHCGCFGHNKRKCTNEPNEARIKAETNKRKYLTKDLGESLAQPKKKVQKKNTSVGRHHINLPPIPLPKKNSKTTTPKVMKPSTWPLPVTGTSSSQATACLDANSQTLKNSTSKKKATTKKNAKPSWNGSTKVVEPCSTGGTVRAEVVSKHIFNTQPLLRRSPRKLPSSSSQPLPARVAIGDQPTKTDVKGKLKFNNVKGRKCQ